MQVIDLTLLEKYRKQKGITQEQIAQELKMMQGTYSNKAKRGTFTDQEINIICSLLGIKKEQILFDTKPSELQFLTSKAIQTESALKVMLGAIAELLARQTGGNVTKVRADLESTVDSLSRQALEKLQHQA